MDNKISVRDIYREQIMGLEEYMKKLPNAVAGDQLPLKHIFVDGMYLREIQVPKNYLVITHIHKFSNPVFLMEGDCSVLEEDGWRRHTAPAYFISKAGAKRVVYCHEDVVWVTVNVTKETDIDKIEESIYASSFEEMDKFIGGVKCLEQS